VALPRSLYIVSGGVGEPSRPVQRVAARRHPDGRRALNTLPVPSGRSLILLWQMAPSYAEGIWPGTRAVQALESK